MNNFESLTQLIEQTHYHFQQQAAKSVNISLTMRNWLIGFYIVEFEQNGEDRAIYGKKLLTNLANKYKKIKGLDERSLRKFRTFYFFYPQIKDIIINNLPSTLGQSLTPKLLKEVNPIRGSLTPKSQNTDFQLEADHIINKLSYTHIEQLLKIDDPLKRVFYELECIKGVWSVRELKRQINSLYFERSAMSKNPEKLSKLVQSKTEVFSPINYVKTLYAFEFLNINTQEIVSESNLEQALINHLQEFIVELGNGFCFEARQKKILIDDEYYFVDLVFYHRILKCHILIELKADQFKHEHLSQLNTYVSYYREEIKQPDDNPPIGILLCTEKGKKLVEYALSGMDEKLFVSKYLVQLPSKEVLQNFIENELKKLEQNE
jgi:predicted nuclease of restriction endonuclease-like (RecB) superfamily